MSRQRYVTKVAQSATATWRISCQIKSEVGLRTLLKQKKNCKDVFNFFFAGMKIKTRPNYRKEKHI